MHYFYSYEEYKERVFPIYLATFLFIIACINISLIIHNVMLQTASGMFFIFALVLISYMYVVSHRLRILCVKCDEGSHICIRKYPSVADNLLRTNMKSEVIIKDVLSVKATNSFIIVNTKYTRTKNGETKDKKGRIVIPRVYNNNKYLIQELESYIQSDR